MSIDLVLRPPAHLTAPDALHISQQAPEVIKKSTSSFSLPWPLSLFTTSDAPEKWVSYENLFYSCLRTGDNKSAYACLEKLKARFGEGNERVMGLVGLYHEATAPDEKALETVLKSYEEAITENPTNLIIRKRHVALLRCLGRIDGAIAALVDLLDAVPVDAEAWSELADMYYVQGRYGQAIFCLEEVLLVTPNAWNIHACLAEVVYLSTLAASSGERNMLKGLTRSMKSFCRSIELCDNYLRGFYGLKMVTTRLKRSLQSIDRSALSRLSDEEDGLAPPTMEVVERLNELATVKLAEIIRKFSTGDSEWIGYEEAEVIAVRELLDRDVEKVPR